MPKSDKTKKQKCRICGCTDGKACPGGCHWVEKDLCSNPDCLGTIKVSGIFSHDAFIKDLVSTENEKKDFKKWLEKTYPKADEEEKARHWRWWIKYESFWIYHIKTIIPNNRIECAIETKQQYEDFTKEEILNVLEKLGKAAILMYRSERNVFLQGKDNLSSLEQKYIQNLEYIVWWVATFKQEGEDSFTDLVTRLRNIQ
jgi:hypothetical protein